MDYCWCFILKTLLAGDADGTSSNIWIRAGTNNLVHDNNLRPFLSEHVRSFHPCSSQAGPFHCSSSFHLVVDVMCLLPLRGVYYFMRQRNTLPGLLNLLV